MKFTNVKVYDGKETPKQSIPHGGLVIWFEKGTDKVWLDWWAGYGPWIAWEKGRSIGDCLKSAPENA